MHGHDALTLNSLLLLYRFANVLNMRSLFLQLNTFYNALSRLVSIFMNYSIFIVFTCIRSDLRVYGLVYGI
jgi:hypothetical protein